MLVLHLVIKSGRRYVRCFNSLKNIYISPLIDSKDDLAKFLKDNFLASWRYTTYRKFIADLDRIWFEVMILPYGDDRRFDLDKVENKWDLFQAIRYMEYEGNIYALWWKGKI